MSSIEIKSLDPSDDTTWDIIAGLEKAVFDQPLSKEELLRELQSKSGLIVLIACIDQIPCAYKAGYEHSPKRFYSWIGGVHPSHRGQGLAKALMEKQHEIAKSQGFKYVATQTKNRFKPMLILNLKSGFDVIGFRMSLSAEDPTIILEKAL